MDQKYHLNYFTKKWGDRKDGWRVRNVDALFLVIPYFLRTRLDSQNLYEETFPIDHLEEFIKKHKEEIPDLSIMHVIMAAFVRLYSQRPQLNRFVVWNKLYARNHISIALVIKRSMTIDGEETVVKPHFLPTDTIYDVARSIQAELEKNKQEGQQNDVDNISKFMGIMPPFLLRLIVGILRRLDGYGWLPEVLRDASPWHSSIFLTNIGSIGIGSIYHHLYEFGTTSVFVAMGKKSRIQTINSDGSVKNEKALNLKVVSDERICDGFYYASSLRLFSKIINNPEALLLPPDNVVIDEGVRKIRK